MENSLTVVRQFLMNMKKIYANNTELHLCGHDLLSVQHGFQDAIHTWLCVNRLQFNVCIKLFIPVQRHKLIKLQGIGL